MTERDDPLWQFSDSAMHRSCFLTWDRRAYFVEKFNDSVAATSFGNGKYYRMESNGDISVLKRNG